MPLPYCFDYCSFLCAVWNLEYDSSSFVFLLMIVLAIQGLLWFYINFKITCSNSVKNAIGILIENVLSLQIAFTSMDILATCVLIQSMNTEYFLVCLCLLHFLYWCSFQSTGLSPPWLSLLLGIFWCNCRWSFSLISLILYY